MIRYYHIIILLGIWILLIPILGFPFFLFKFLVIGTGLFLILLGTLLYQETIPRQTTRRSSSLSSHSKPTHSTPDDEGHSSSSELTPDHKPSPQPHTPPDTHTRTQPAHHTDASPRARVKPSLLSSLRRTTQGPDSGDIYEKLR